MSTREYKTKTILEKRRNPYKKENLWDMAIDMGYSAIKGMSRNFLFCFPNYAIKLPINAVVLGQPQDTDILYRDGETRTVYAVGAKAESMISTESTNDNNSTLYGRNRYFSEIFRITSRVALGLSLLSNEYGNPVGKKLRLQTGLPPAYMPDDTALLKEAFAGHYDFDLKIGNSDWVHFEFQLNTEDIRVMQQPMGTLISVSTDKNGNPTSDAQKIFTSKVLTFDPGFRTGDTCYIKRGTIDPDDCHTDTNLSMIEVLTRTVKELKEKHNVSISVPSIQPYLESGEVKTFDRKALKSKNIAFDDILDAQSKIVCDKAIDKLLEIYNYFLEVDYLIITGGTGAAWSNIIRNRLKDMDTLTIISGNRTDDLPHIFSNVRGYYMYLINRP